MKGLVGGIPLALLVAAVANGHGEVAQDEGPVTLIGGPSGTDGGNSAAITFDSSYSSSVKDTYKDDHDVGLKNTVVGRAAPHPAVPGFDKRQDRDGTIFGGPSGNDGGNSAEIEFESAYSSVVEDWYKDDHSADIKNTVITPPPPHPPFPGFRKRGGGDGTIFGGPSGNDGGNSAEIEFDSSYASAVEDWYKDDHSLYEENHIVHPPPVPGFRKRGGGDGTIFGGPSGNDGGNSVEVEFDSSYASSVKDYYKDDHSVDIKNHIVHPPPVPGFRKRGDRDGTIFGGPSGNDGGNSVEVELDSTYASSVKDYYKDDHSVDIKNHIVHPPPVPGFRRRGDREGTIFGGPSGNDGGNSVEVEFDSTYASSVKDYYKDDHSVDIKNHIVHPPPVPGFRRRGDREGTIFGGPSGNDGGNSVEVEFDSAYASSVKDYYKDDHSVGIKNTVIHPPPVSHPPPVPGFRKRGDRDGTIFGGPSGNDGGNSADFDFESTYASSVKDYYKDDHSVDIKNHIVHPPPVVYPPPVPGFRKRDDGGSHISSPHHHEHAKPTVVGDVGIASKDGDGTIFGGPSGNDGGSSADTEFDNKYSSEVEDHYKDDHSVDIKNHVYAPAVPKGFRKRGGDPVIFDGPSGDDEGNSADFDFDDKYSSKVNEHYADDHSVKLENWIVQAPPPPPPPRPQPPRPQPPRPQGPPPPYAGNPEPLGPPPPFAGNPEPLGPPPPFAGNPEPVAHPPPFAGNPEPPYAVDPATSKPCSTSTYLETIIKTVDDPVPTKPAAPYRPPEHSQIHEPKPSGPYEPTHTYEPTHPAASVPTGVSPTHEAEAPKGQHDPGFEKPEPVRTPCTSSKPEAHAAPTAPSYPPQGDPHADPHAYSEDSGPANPVHDRPPAATTPCPTRKPEGHRPEPTAPAYQPQHADPKEAPKHAPTSAEPLTAITSTITVSHTSTWAVVPVYMDNDHKSSCTSADRQRPSDVDAKAHQVPSPTSSQAVKPSHHATPSSTPSQAAKPSHNAGPSSASPSQNQMFTGAAGRIAPAAGVVSAVCGLMAVLAFVL